jgi:hypothetical protein
MFRNRTTDRGRYPLKNWKQGSQNGKKILKFNGKTGSRVPNVQSRNWNLEFGMSKTCLTVGLSTVSARNIPGAVLSNPELSFCEILLDAINPVRLATFAGSAA